MQDAQDSNLGCSLRLEKNVVVVSGLLGVGPETDSWLRKPWTVLQAVTGLCLSWGDVRFLKHLSSLDAMGLEVLTMLRRHLQVQKQYPSLAQKHFNGSEHTSDVLHTCCLMLFVPLKASRQNHYLL